MMGSKFIQCREEESHKIDHRYIGREMYRLIASGVRSGVWSAVRQRSARQSEPLSRAFSAATQEGSGSSVASGSDQARLNLSLPYKSLYKNEPVHTVILPGLVGEYGVTGAHQPILSELKPGVVQVFKSEGAEPDKYFVSGGFAVTHPDATTDVSVAEAVPLTDLDPLFAQKAYADFRQKADSAALDSPERAEFQLAAETYEAICHALGVQA